MKKRSLHDWIVPKSRVRLLALFAVVLGLFIWNQWFRWWWRPTVRLTTEHYLVLSTAAEDETREVAAVVESLYKSYMLTFGTQFAATGDHPKLRLKLFANREEFRRCNRGVRWAEAFYRKPYCHAYYSRGIRPYHWMAHEAVHQLNHEVARLDIPKWIDEGLATYLGTSVYRDGAFRPGEIDVDTYPIWWLNDMALTADIRKDIANEKIIPLRQIISGRGGPDVDRHFNLYYIHWWSLTHFLLHYRRGQYREAYTRVITEGGSLKLFEAHVGPVENIQVEWHGYLRDRIRLLSNPRASPATQ